MHVPSSPLSLHTPLLPLAVTGSLPPRPPNSSNHDTDAQCRCFRDPCPPPRAGPSALAAPNVATPQSPLHPSLKLGRAAQKLDSQPILIASPYFTLDSPHTPILSQAGKDRRLAEGEGEGEGVERGMLDAAPRRGEEN